MPAGVAMFSCPSKPPVSHPARRLCVYSLPRARQWSRQVHREVLKCQLRIDVRLHHLARVEQGLQEDDNFRRPIHLTLLRQSRGAVLIEGAFAATSAEQQDVPPPGLPDRKLTQ